MPTDTQIIDPRELDGEPFEVASAAVDHAGYFVAVAADVLDKARPVVRNAALERAIQAGDDLNAVAEGFDTSPQGRVMQAVNDQLRGLEARLTALALAASYDPAHPPLEA